MAGTGAYAMPAKLPFVAKKPLKRAMSKEARAHFEELFSEDIEIFEDENTGELYSKVTDLRTGKTKIMKCEYTDED